VLDDSRDVGLGRVSGRWWRFKPKVIGIGRHCEEPRRQVRGATKQSPQRQIINYCCRLGDCFGLAPRTGSPGLAMMEAEDPLLTMYLTFSRC
jgi:hypothetical protein